MRVALTMGVLLALLAGCLQAGARDCAFGTCPDGFACDDIHRYCVLPEQLSACSDTGLVDGDDCAAAAIEGVCADGVCLAKGCGDFRVSAAEQCDGDRFIGPADCRSAGYYGEGPIACNADCTIDDSACRDAGFAYCGDGVVDRQFEACDFMAADSTATCAALGFHTGDTAPCTAGCTYLTDGNCAERCGDGILNGNELCEPTLGIASYLSCLDYGYDSGVLACGTSCSPDLDECHRIGLWPVGSLAGYPSKVWQASIDDAFVVGGNSSMSGGLVQRWNGATVVELGATGPGVLLGVHGTAATNVFAVGRGGRIVHFDGTQLTTHASGVTNDLYDVSVLAPNNAYAVGAGGTFLHYDGTAWTAMPTTPTTGDTILGIWAAGPTDMWAVGGNSVWRGNGTAWTETITGVAGPFQDVWGTSASNVYVIGANGATIGVVRRWNGTGWSAVPMATNVNLRAIWGSADDDITIATTEGRLVHYDGIRWQQLAGTTTANTQLTSISGIDRSHMLLLDSNNRLVRFEGVAWGLSVSFGGAMPSLWGTSITNLYGAGTSYVQRYDGTLWLPAYTPSSAVTAIWGTSSTNIFAGGTAMYRRDVSSWNGMTLPPETDGADIMSIWGTSASDVYAAFSGAPAGGMYLYNGVAWTAMTAQPSGTPIALWGTSSTHIVGVGLGAIWTFDGSSWSRFDVPATTLWGVWGTSATDIYAVGTGGSLLHFDGTTWTRIPLTTTQTLYAVHGTGPSDVWVGGGDVMYHYNGNGWSPVTAPFPNLRALWIGERDIVTVSGQTVTNLIRPCATCL